MLSGLRGGQKSSLKAKQKDMRVVEGKNQSGFPIGLNIPACKPRRKGARARHRTPSKGRRQPSISPPRRRRSAPATTYRRHRRMDRRSQLVFKDIKMEDAFIMAKTVKEEKKTWKKDGKVTCEHHYENYSKHRMSEPRRRRN
mmetsp:Transcript_22757/g.33935  ORF Transcript_22757/g.33935 Transcript_22757/m.33935 type:complete len:142 (+) Transcript_22757:16-441(+)